MTHADPPDDHRQFVDSYHARCRRDVWVYAGSAALLGVASLFLGDATLRTSALLACAGYTIGATWAWRALPPRSDDSPQPAYRLAVAHGLARSAGATRWLVLPLIPGTAALGAALVGAGARFLAPPALLALGVGTAVVLLVAWRALWAGRRAEEREMQQRQAALTKPD